MSSTEPKKLASLEKYLLELLAYLGDWCFQPNRPPEDILKDLEDKIFSVENSYWKLVEDERSNCLTINVFRNDKARLTLRINHNQELEILHTSGVAPSTVSLAELHLDHEKFLELIKGQLKIAYSDKQRH